MKHQDHHHDHGSADPPAEPAVLSSNGAEPAAPGPHVSAGHHQHAKSAEPHGAGHSWHDKHAGHSVAMFRDKFWISLALTIPALVWGHMLRNVLRYRAPHVPGSGYISAIFGSALAGRRRGRRGADRLALEMQAAQFAAWRHHRVLEADRLRPRSLSHEDSKLRKD